MVIKSLPHFEHRSALLEAKACHIQEDCTLVQLPEKMVHLNWSVSSAFPFQNGLFHSKYFINPYMPRYFVNTKYPEAKGLHIPAEGSLLQENNKEK